MARQPGGNFRWQRGGGMLDYFVNKPRLSQKAIENREEDLERVQAERSLGDAISAFLFVIGVLTLLLFTIHVFNNYFGEEERYNTLENEFDEFNAMMNFLRDLVEGWALGAICIGASWLVARSLLRWTRDDEYVSVGTGQVEARDARVAEAQEGGVGTATEAQGSPGYRGPEGTADTDASI